ncbi:MAG: UDP-N-acetylmuramate dehydrogenase [Nitriliruptoraceae bacterium]
MTPDPVAVELAARCGGEVRADAPLAPGTTLKVGGSARVLVVAESDRDLAAVGAVTRAHGLPWAVIGRGSNLLVADAGWPGVAIVLGRGYRGLRTGGPEVHVGAAEPLPTLAVQLADAGYTGFAWACSVPGTVGGAVRMNAGAHGGAMVDHLVEAELVRLSTGTREQWPAGLLGLAYRSSQLPSDAVVVAATLQLDPGDPTEERARIDRIRTWRRTHQPLNQPNCGSVFTNPPGDSAGRLIDAAGLKGRRIGGAEVSTRHANFIVTRPGATASDVATLIALVQTEVTARFGIELHPEVQRLGAVEVDAAALTPDRGAGPAA